MTAAAAPVAPRLTGGVIASVLLHGGLIAAFVFMHSGRPSAPPQMIMIHMVAAPEGEAATGVVQSNPTPVVETPPPPTPTPAVKPKPVAAKPKPAPKVATPQTSLKNQPAKPATAAPAAAGGSSGGRGADVANIDTPGIVFDYPFYTNNIVRRLVLRFGAMSGSLEAEVRFVIHRDGSVTNIALVTPSGNYSFDQRALGAVEGAANAKEFGALPPGFNEDILPVTFRFSPRVIR